MPSIHRLACAGALACTAAAAAQAQAAPSPSRGELLYTTHCIECHTTRMHWREGRRANDWLSLRAQVRRWQGVAGLGWSESDVAEVARYLNDTIYRFPQEPPRAGTKRDARDATASGATVAPSLNWTAPPRARS